MAELVTSMMVGPLVSMVKDKASSYLLEQYGVMDGMEDMHEILKRKLPAILDVITDAEEQAAARREGAKAWLEALKKVAYEANEVFDEFKYEALRREAKKKGHYSKLGFDAVKLFPTHNRIVFRYRMGNKLHRILQAIEVLVTEMNAFRFTYRPQPLVSKQWRQTDSIMVDPENIVSESRKEDKQEIVKKLLHPANPKELTILPIVGMGGLGKTTLAQLIYNDPEIGEHFQLLPWVCVSDNFDVDFVAKSIVEAAPKVKDDKPKKGVQEEKDVTSSTPLGKLQNLVSGQRYLLVLDDIWKHNADSEWEDKWEKLKTCLQHGGVGSAVMTTTRDKGVAKLMGTVGTHDLTALKNNFIEEIIKKRAFSSQKEEEMPNVLVNMVNEFVKRCAGSPLAAKALGSVLRTKTSEEEWKAVLSKSSAYSRDTEILPILKLSYDDLPSPLKQCFAFCAVFPKDYEIDVEMLIQLWMANSFIPEEKGVRLETTGTNTFNELASRSFFQDVKRVPFGKDKSKHGYCSRIICKMHDLMHDVALSMMERECFTITEKHSPNELFPNSARHVFLSCYKPEAILNDSLKKTSPAIQTLLCHELVYSSLQHLSKYSSVRALHLKQHESAFLLKPEHLHYLRYLNLSGSYIIALPEEISILYNLQTLNLSGCCNLRRLPKHMKYMTALRHLYTHGCRELKSMPPDLRQLTSLQTLTCFVVGAGSDCSNLGELRDLNLGGRLELHQLENVTEADAKAANLRNKKELTELTLIWANREKEELHYHKVLEGLEPHDGLQALKIYESRCFPTWISMLKNLVELCLSGCDESHRLPPLWKLPELRVLCLARLKKLQCLCRGDTSLTFLKLKELKLESLLDFERWWETNERLEGQLLFPQLEKLLVKDCKKLTALPEAPPVGEYSAFPELKDVELDGLTSFKSWGATGGTDGEQPIFPNLESLHIEECPELTTLPEAPKLSVLSIGNGNQQIFPWVARYMTSLTNLNLDLQDTETTSPAEHSLTELVELVNGMEKWNHKSPLTVMKLYGCNFFFRSGALALWTCFVQLQDLDIRFCDALVHWPEKEFQSLVSLRRLIIVACEKLTGCAQAPEQSASESSQLLPRLESLKIGYCESLVEVFNVPASLREMAIRECHKLESIFGKQQGKSALVFYASTSVPESLESLEIWWCDSLTELPDLPQSIKELEIRCCSRLKSLKSRSGELPWLERLDLRSCKTLASLPDGPQAYSSLQWLKISECPAIKTLPRSLQQRLGSLQLADLDGLYEVKLMKSDQVSKFVPEFVLFGFVSFQMEDPSSFIGTIILSAICYVKRGIQCPANIKIYIEAAIVVLIYYVSLLKINLSYIWLAIFPFMVLVFIGALYNELSHQSGSQRRDNGEAHSRSIRTGTTGYDAVIPYWALCWIGRYGRDDSFIVSQFLLFLSSTLGALTLMMARLAPTATGVAPGIATASELLRKASLVVLLVTVHTMAAEFLGEDVVLFCLPELVPVVLWFSLHLDRGSSIISVDEIKSRKNWLIALGAVLAPAFAYLAASMDESGLSWCTRTSVSFGVSGLLIYYVVFMLCQWPGQAGTVTTTLKEAVQLLKFWANVLLIAAAVLLVFTSLAAAWLGLHGPKVATLAKSFDDYVPRFSNWQSS